jgi:quinolinate synthase
MPSDANPALLPRLRELKERRRAVILAHNYQRPEVQDAADLVADSLGLAQFAAKTDAEVILLCGVHFMAETAAILCPGKTVVVPDARAGCPMADMISERELAEEVRRLGNPTVVTYVNSTARIKARSDFCCTSSNAVKVVAAADPGRPVLFVPDRSLGAWAAAKAGRRDVSLWRGYCPTHHRILARDVEQARRDHPGAVVVVHPECEADVVRLADHVASTSGMLDFCARSPAKEFVIGTEVGMLHPLAKACPWKRFHPATALADCPNMKLNTLEKMVWALEDMTEVVTVPEPVRTQALRAIRRMLELA